MTDADEPTNPDDAFDFEGEVEGEAPPQGWLSAVGQMAAALLVVVAIVALFIGAAVVVRRLLP